MTVLTIQAAPFTRVPVRALSVLDALWIWGRHLAARFAALSEPSTPAEVLAWAQQIEHSQPGFAAELRAAATAGLGDDDSVAPRRR